MAQVCFGNERICCSVYWKFSCSSSTPWFVIENTEEVYVEAGKVVGVINWNAGKLDCAGWSNTIGSIGGCKLLLSFCGSDWVFDLDLPFAFAGFGGYLGGCFFCAVRFLILGFSSCTRSTVAVCCCWGRAGVAGVCTRMGAGVGWGLLPSATSEMKLSFQYLWTVQISHFFALTVLVDWLNSWMQWFDLWWTIECCKQWRNWDYSLLISARLHHLVNNKS